MAKGIKTGGRQKNSLNKVSTDLRISITEFLENNFDEVVNEWNNLQGKDKVNFYKDLLKYSVPALHSTEIKAPKENIVIQMIDPDTNIVENVKTIEF